MEHHTTTVASAAGSSSGTGGTSKKHTRSRGRSKKPEDPYASAYGIVPFKMLRKRPWTSTRDLGESMVGKHVMLFGAVRRVQQLGRSRTVLVLFSSRSCCSVRCVVAADDHDGGVTTRMVRFAATLSRQTAVDVEGVVSLPESGMALGTTQQVEIQVTKLHPIESAATKQHQRKSQHHSKTCQAGGECGGT